MNRRHALPIVALTLLSCAALCATAPARADEQDEDKRTVALLPLLGSGLALDEMTSAGAAIQREVDARYGERSLPAPLVRERLEEGAKRGLRCDRSVESCQAQLGIVCDTDLVLIASLTPSADDGSGSNGGFAMALRLVDVAEAAQLAFVSASYAGVPTSADIKALLVALDEPAARATQLVVTGPSGAPVVVDGVAHGSLPLPSPLELPIGHHEVVVHSSPPYATTVTLRRGERVDVVAPAAALAVAPPSEPPPPPVSPELSGDVVDPGVSPRMMALAGGGALAAVGVGAVVVGLVPLLNYASAADLLRGHEDETVTDPTYLDRNSETIADTRALYESSRDEWNAYGQLALVTGSAALVVGTAILVVGLVALE